MSTSSAVPSPSRTMPSSRCSVEMYDCPICMASRRLFSSTRLTRGVKDRCPDTSVSSSMATKMCIRDRLHDDAAGIAHGRHVGQRDGLVGRLRVHRGHEVEHLSLIHISHTSPD